MRFASLGSGSRGNATLVQSGSTCVLVDCGFSLSETERRLQRLGLEAGALSAILVTHEHTDHVQGVARLARRHRLPVWLTHGTHQACADKLVAVEDLHFFHAHEDFAIDGLQVQPFPVPHDAREPAQFVFSDGARRLGVLTDFGSITPHIQRSIDHLDALLLESNHDHAMLWQGDYPPQLKQRVGGHLGHLSNDQAAELLCSLHLDRLQHLVAAHLSEKNNAPEQVTRTWCAALDCPADWVQIAGQQAGLDWRDVR